MSMRRLVFTATVMAGIGLLLHAVAPGWGELARALTHPQRLADTEGAETVVLCVAGALAEAIWAWGALGLLLTAAGALPGALGGAGRLLVRVLLPAGARRAAALALGVGIGLTGPLLTGTALAAPVPTAASAIPDWPTAAVTSPSAPDWPTPLPRRAHVVLRGECLWTIAAGWLQADTGQSPTDAEIATAVQAWWHVNGSVIGPDPDRLLPGQVLQAPVGR